MFDEQRLEEIRTSCERLQRDLVYQMSLGSMELFHSNFLAWTFDNVSGSAENLLEPWLPDDFGLSGTGRCLREYKSLDLVVFLPQRGPVVIENKMFSPLDPRQLVRYDAVAVPLSNDVDGGPESMVRSCHRIALTLLEPSSQVSCAGWQMHRYDALQHWLDTCVIDAMHDGFEREFVTRYRNLLLLLINFRDSLAIRDSAEPVELPPTALVGEEVTRLSDISSKVRMAATIDHLSSTVPPSSVVKYRFGFTRKSALVECFFTTPFEGHEVGWQYQDKRLKVVVRLRDPDGHRFKGKRKTRENFVERHFQEGWFNSVDFGELMGGGVGSGVLAPLGSSARSAGWRYLGYEPDFVYRCVPAAGLTVGQLDAINHALHERAINTVWA